MKNEIECECVQGRREVKILSPSGLSFSEILATVLNNAMKGHEGEEEVTEGERDGRK